MKRRNIMNWGAVTVAALAGLRLYLYFNPSPPPVDLRPHLVLGQTLATEAINSLDANSRLTVIAREVAEFNVPAAEGQLDGFLSTLKKAGKSVTVTRHLKVDPLRVVAVPPGEFFDLIRQANANDVIVSFLGPPTLSDEQVAKLGEKRPKVLAACPGAMPARVDLRRLFNLRLLTAAVVSRPDAPAAPGPGSAQAAFDQMFKVINAGNLAELPSLATNGGVR